MRKHKVGKLNKFDWRILVMFLPGIIFVMLFTLYPILKTMIMSFFDWKIGYQQVSTYVGIDNYISVFSDPIAKIALVNTLVYAIVTVPLQMVFGLLVALIIFKLTRFSTTFRLGYYLPVITSWVVVALLFRYLFANKGVINYLIVDVFKISNSPVRWLSSRWSALS
ncbi:MAG: sugar ABC transporter permease, partial [Acholeplasmataceae bacterium]|nr:sugar ABC transporter permease [Acholeplasmataceae bacterium]